MACLLLHDSRQKTGFVYQEILAMPSVYIDLQGIQEENRIH